MGCKGSRDNFEDTVLIQNLFIMLHDSASQSARKTEENHDEKDARQSYSEFLRDSYRCLKEKRHVR